jgi:hypothetical protein
MQRSKRTDSGFPMIFATALLASLRKSDVLTASPGTLVCSFKVGILEWYCWTSRSLRFHFLQASVDSDYLST